MINIRWCEFDYNMPEQSMQQRLRYENGDDSFYEEFYDIKNIKCRQEEDDWNLKMELELKI